MVGQNTTGIGWKVQYLSGQGPHWHGYFSDISSEILGLYPFAGDWLSKEWLGSQGKIEPMEHSRLDFAAAGVAGDFFHTFSNFILGKNILSAIYSYAAVAALILLFIVILPCIVRTL